MGSNLKKSSFRGRQKNPKHWPRILTFEISINSISIFNTFQTKTFFTHSASDDDVTRSSATVCPTLKASFIVSTMTPLGPVANQPAQNRPGSTFPSIFGITPFFESYGIPSSTGIAK